MKEIEDAFIDTTKIVLGTGLRGLEAYGEWLGGRVPLPVKGKSAKSGKEVWLQPPLVFLKKPFDAGKIVDMDEAESVNKSPFGAGDLRNADLRKVLEIVKPITYYCGNLRYKNCKNIEKSSGVADAINIYYSEDVDWEVKNVAYGNYVLYSENMFGCHHASYSRFCIHSYNSVDITRGFEVDGCLNSSDVYFCHNSENLNNCILCFNAKNLRYAVGNTEVGREKFLEIKKMLLDYVVGELKKKKQLGVDIFNVGCLKAP
jgi:hypothetical protein